jgi:hypothetical protein
MIVRRFGQILVEIRSAGRKVLASAKNQISRSFGRWRGISVVTARRDGEVNAHIKSFPGLDGMEAMSSHFQVAEHSAQPCKYLALLRSALVIISVWFGAKFRSYEASGIAPFLTHSPLLAASTTLWACGEPAT